jgi:hypothetical protein
MKKNLTSLFGAFVLAFMCGTQGIAQTQKNISFTAKLDGTQEVPLNNTTALGVAHLTLTPKFDSLIVRVDYTGLQSAFSAAHIHLGAPGIAGGVIFSLPAPVNNIIKTVITGSALTPTVLTNLFTGNYYVNIHSANLVDGEIRGQIVPEADINFSTILNAAQEVPVPTNIAAFGVASFKLAKHTGVLSYEVLVNNLSGPITAGHIHKGVMGVAGPAIYTLTQIGNNKFKGEVDPTAFLPALFRDSLYVNVHTTANPDGEARGQIHLVNGFAASAMINSAQEVPAPTVPTKANGLGEFHLSTDLDSIFVIVALDSLTGKINSAHLHKAVPGTAGGVVLDLSTGITADSNAILFSGPINPAVINSILHDSVYFNVHTMANTSGEIRGQLMPLARYTGTVCLTGGQESPATNSTATGGGIVSFSRDMTNAHVMYVANGLSSNVTATHIHQGLFGANGSPVYTLTSSYMNNGVFVYLKNTDAAPFMPETVNQGLKDSLYVNIHTSNFPNGEIRGQIGRGCPDNITGISDATPLASAAVYPNPTTNELHIQLPLSVSERVNVRIYDMMGKLVLNNDYNALNLINLSVGNFNKGLYLIQITSGSEVFQSKFGKE